MEDTLGSSYLNFTVGPVMMDPQLLSLGAEPSPYFRTPEFSDLMFRNEAMLLQLLNADEGSRAVFITGSGTASMEAAVASLYGKEDKVLVVNGGSFGARFAQLLSLHGIPNTQIVLEPGKTLTREMLDPYEGKGYTGFLLQHDETSTGVLYDMNLVGDFCLRNKLFLTVDCISSFLADAADMKQWGAGAVIVGSQKAIALPPGISAIALNGEGVARAEAHDAGSLYLDVKVYLKNMERGQTPFTPAVGTLIQMNARMTALLKAGGAHAAVREVRERALYFRKSIEQLPFDIFPETPANGVTALAVRNGADAKAIFMTMKDKHHIFVCPNGGDLEHKVFRVGHIGVISTDQVDRLVAALSLTLEELAK